MKEKKKKKKKIKQSTEWLCELTCDIIHSFKWEIH